MFTTIIRIVLRIMARAVLARRRPVVIGITGSVGKTTAKDALTAILAHTWGRGTVRGSAKSFNNEIGVPLAIIGMGRLPGASPLAWVEIVLRWLGAVTLAPYPRTLVLEMGIDRVGDMAYLTSLVPPTTGVVTTIAGSHLAVLGSLDAIAREKGILIDRLPVDGTAVLNADDPLVVAMRSRTQARVLTYSAAGREDADVAISDVRCDCRAGVRFKVNYAGKSVPVRLPHVIGIHLLPSIVAAIAAALAHGVNLVAIGEALGSFAPSPGRLRLLAGHNDTIVIDDAYNANAVSTSAAIAAIGDCTGRHVVVLGDMLELGPDEEALHRSLAAPLVAHAAVVVLAGRRMRWLADELHTRQFAGDVVVVDTPMEAAMAVKRLVRSGDVVLIKGSQGMRMEKVCEVLVADHDRARICRQDPSWQATPFVQP